MMTLFEIFALTLPMSMILIALRYGPRLSRHLENARLDREQYGA
jgi:hypothetical protein